MSTTPTIDALIASGVCVLYHDYRSRSFKDWAGQGNDGVPTATSWTGAGLAINDATSVVTVSDNAGLQLTELSLIVFGEYNKFDAALTNRLVSKRDVGGANYDFRAQPDRLSYYDGVNTRSLLSVPSDYSCIGISSKSGEKAEGFFDGNSAGLFTDVSTLTADDAPLLIGNVFNDNSQIGGTTYAALIFNRALTAPEHLAVYNELSARCWPTKTITRYTGGAHMEWGANESVAAVTAGYLENTPWQVQSGAFKVSADTIEGEAVKVIECTTAGIVSMPVSELRQSYSEAAYGAWEWWFSKVDTSTASLRFINSEDLASLVGYNIIWRSTETVSLRKTSGSLITTGEISIGWRKFCVDRSAVGLFDLIIDGVSEGTATDNTITDAYNIVADLNAGDKIALSDRAGNHSFVKDTL